MDWSTDFGWRSAPGLLEEHAVIDPAKPSKPVFVWKIDDAETLEIPLVSDRLELAQAKLPAGVTIETLPN